MASGLNLKVAQIEPKSDSKSGTVSTETGGAIRPKQVAQIEPYYPPSQYQLSDLPTPNSAAVSLVSQDSMKLAVLRFGGFSSDEKIAKHAQLLTQVLEKNNIRTKGSLLYMGYNAPWDVINRRNEVAFQIDSIIEKN